MIDVIIPTVEVEKAIRLSVSVMQTAGVKTWIHIAHDPGMTGFTRNVNKALRASHNEYVCLLNDDVELVQKDWLRALYDVIEADEKIGFVGPTFPCRTPPQNKAGPVDVNPMKVSHLAFGCVLLRRRAIEGQDYLDESYWHYGSDVDAQFKAKVAGWQSWWVPRVFVDHEVRDPIPNWHAHDARLFKRRWGIS